MLGADCTTESSSSGWGGGRFQTVPGSCKPGKDPGGRWITGPRAVRRGKKQVTKAWATRDHATRHCLEVLTGRSTNREKQWVVCFGLVFNQYIWDFKNSCNFLKRVYREFCLNCTLFCFLDAQADLQWCWHFSLHFHLTTDEFSQTFHYHLNVAWGVMPASSLSKDQILLNPCSTLQA